jgi:hypothetical protein
VASDDIADRRNELEGNVSLFQGFDVRIQVMQKAAKPLLCKHLSEL